MASSSTSAIKNLNQAIASYNPFKRPAIVSDLDIWEPGLPDVITLNRHASDVVLQAIQAAGPTDQLLTSITITGPNGSGKSHLIARLRHHLQINPTALFVYADAGQFTDLNLIRYQFQQTLVNSLRHIGSQGVMQWQQLAAEIANRALKSISSTAKTYSPLELARNLYGNTLAKNQTWINQLTEAFFRIKPQIGDPDVIRAIVWTLCNAQAPYALKWLAGQVLNSLKADELGLPNRHPEYRDADAWTTVLHILNTITDYYGVMICFDQLESLDNGETGLKRERVVASLVKRLFDTIQLASLNRPIVVVTVMTPETWGNKIMTLPRGIASYLVGQGEPIELSQITDDGIVELISLWLRKFYAANNLTPPTPVYPFEMGQLRALGREHLSWRQVLEWCAENFQPVEVDPFEQVERAFEQAKSLELDVFLNHHGALADVLYFAFETLKGQTVAGVMIESVCDRIRAKPANHGYIQFRVMGSEKGKWVCIGVAVVQENHPKTVCAALKRLVQYEKFELTRGCLVRFQEPEIPPHWQAYSYLTQLHSELGGRLVNGKLADMKPLLAIWRLEQQRLDYELSTEQIVDFVRSRKIAAENPLIRAILTHPTREVTENIFSTNPLETVPAPLEDYTDLAPLDATGEVPEE